MRTWLRPALALTAVFVLLLGAACSSDDDEGTDTTEATDDAEASGNDDAASSGGDVPIDESCLVEDPDAITATAVREYLNCVLDDEPVVGVGSSGSPDDPDQAVDLSTFVGDDVPLEICYVGSPLIFDELGLTDAEVTVLLLDADGGEEVAVERSGADDECTPT